MKNFLAFFIPRIIFRSVVAGIAVVSLVGAMFLGSVSPILASSIASMAGALGMSTLAQDKSRSDAEKKRKANDAEKKRKANDAEKKRKAKSINKRMNFRMKRIVAANALGAVTTIVVPVAIGFATYEAWLICENSNDNRELLHLIGVEPEPDTIADTCEDIARKWDDTAAWVKERVMGDIDKELATGPVHVYIPEQGWTDISGW